MQLRGVQVICLALFALFASLFPNAGVTGQEAIMHATPGTYHQAMSSAIVYKNDKAAVPIQRLDSMAFACVQIGATYPTVFRLALEKYAVLSDASWNPDIEKLDKRLILVVRDLSPSGADQSDMDSLIHENEVILICPDLEMARKYQTHEHVRAILVQEQETPENSEALAQQLFGGAALREDKPAPTQRLDAMRLGFAPPELFGVNGTRLEARIDAIASEGLDSMAYPGCQVLVAKDGKVIFQKTYGYHTYDRDRAVQKKDIYDLASVTKISSATTALMKLSGEGKFDVDATVKDYFPRFKRTNKADLAWRQILAHNARLKSWIPYWTTTVRKNGKYRCRTLKTKRTRNFPIKLTDNLYLHKKYREKKIYKMIAKSPFNEEPGYLYSGLSFYLYPEIIEDITGQPFERYLKTNIYNRLGASTLTYKPMRFFPLERIIPTERDTFFRHIQLHGIVHDEGAAMMDGISANAGLFASTLDLAKLMQLFLNKGTYGNDHIINPEVIEEFTRCQYCDEGNRRGLGFEKPMIEFDPERSHVSRYVSKQSFGHSGYTGTFAWADPVHDIVFIFMSNRVYPTRLNRKLYTLDIRPRIQDVIYEELGVSN